ncbi:ankyrin [Anaeromyces robustus]|uniref:Ankyrin n=1 Tax=Anaeromyces robustus TaxID=1754192 RepID=A0A1Y1WS55_9FUNG|nr:ankyrin [Anaeromyces robustus]|eukprot:ORX75944.1 ankyrin [Anaeromyces robustus]
MKDIKEIINLTSLKLLYSKSYYLIYAIENNGTIDMIKLLLPYFSSLNNEYQKKYPIYVAIENHKFDIADLLLKEGANINALNKNKENILFYLYNKKKLDKSNLKYILAKNIDINYKFKNLHFIEYLLNKNNNNNSTNNNSNTESKINSIDSNEKIYELIKIIFENLNFKNEFIIELLNLYKCNTLKMSYINEKMETENKTVEITKSMYELAIKSDNEKVIELLLKYDNKAKVFKRKGGYELLLTACKFNKSSIIKRLIECGVNINEIDSEGVNSLMIASQVGNLNIIKILIENNIRINERDYDNKNSLIYATEKGDLEIVQYLVEKQININVCSFSNGWNALFYAIDKNYKDIAVYLIDNDIDMYGNNLKNSNSKDILAFLYEHKNIDLIKYMTEKGVKLDGKYNNGDTLLMTACNNNDIEMVNFLIENGADINAVNLQLLVEKGINIHLKNTRGYTAFLYASKTSNLDMVKYLISKGGNIKDKNNLGYNALIEVCGHNKFEIVKYLIEYGIDINEQANDGGNALTLGIGRADIEIIKYLVKNGIDINHTTNGNFNAAFACIREGKLEELKFLIDEGIDLNCKNYDNCSLIDYAKCKKQYKIYNYLKKKEKEKEKEIELKKESKESNKFSYRSLIKKIILG